MPPTPRAWRSLVLGATWARQYNLDTLIPRHGPFRHSRTVAVAVRRLSQATLLRAHITFAGSIIRTCRRSSRLSSPVIERGAPRCGSVAALGLHGFTIRIRVSRAGVGWRVIRRRVQDRVAARRVFTRSRQSGLHACGAQNVVVGLLCADSVRLWLVSPSRCPCGSKLLLKPVRRLNTCGGMRRGGGR